MLLRFEVSNHRSIMQPIELSMIAVDNDRPAARTFELLDEHVLTIAGIYGPNASGKTNLLAALAWLSSAVSSSLRVWDTFVPREPFRFAGGVSLVSSFKVELMVSGIRYAYHLELNDAAIQFEGLYSYPERRRRTLFIRTGEDLRFQRGLANLAATKELLTPTTLALSAAMRFDRDEIGHFGRALAAIKVHGTLRSSMIHRRGFAIGGFGPSSTERLFDANAAHRQQSLFENEGVGHGDARASALALLQFADLGIDDVEFVEEPAEGVDGVDQRRPDRRRLRLLHRVADQQVPFDLDEESAGTQTWFRLIGPMLSALQSGQILLFDEIDASLHPRLSARLVELFQDPETNPLGAQLIFTTHDTSLLNHLNRDEVWLMEKGRDGASSLTALAEFGGDAVRRSMNLEKAYLSGRFGAVPELDQFVLRRALGLLVGSE